MNKQDIQTVLNALQNSQLFVQASSNINVLEGFGQQLDDADEAIALLRAFLAEPSEPVAEVAGDYNTKHIIFLPAGIALEVGDKLFTHPAPSKPSEPVMIYHGGCTIDCGEHGHHNMEMLKLIPAGTKLFTHPASKPEKLTDEEIKRIQMSDPAYMTCSCPAFARQVEAAVWAKFAAVKQDEAIKEKLK